MPKESKEKDRGTRKVVIWRVEHPSFTRVDADVWDGEEGPRRVLGLDVEKAVALVKGLFVGGTSFPGHRDGE